MIAVDTSALMAIVLNEPEADACIARLDSEDDVLISAATIAEAVIVATRRNVGDDMAQLLGGVGFQVVNVTPAVAHRVAQAYARWGKGAHPAALNFGDCFAYAVAEEHGCPLLFVGQDFKKTDLMCAL